MLLGQTKVLNHSLISSCQVCIGITFDDVILMLFNMHRLIMWLSFLHRAMSHTFTRPVKWSTQRVMSTLCSADVSMMKLFAIKCGIWLFSKTRWYGNSYQAYSYSKKYDIALLFPNTRWMKKLSWTWNMNIFVCLDQLSIYEITQGTKVALSVFCIHTAPWWCYREPCLMSQMSCLKSSTLLWYTAFLRAAWRGQPLCLSLHNLWLISMLEEMVAVKVVLVLEGGSQAGINSEAGLAMGEITARSIHSLKVAGPMASMVVT